MALKYNKKLKSASRKLRKNMTEPEVMLWSKLRRKQIAGLQFYRQKPIEKYVVDFFCPKLNLVIELDGDQHFQKKGKSSDMKRDNFLKSQNLQILRISNIEIHKNLDGAIQQIWNIAERKGFVSDSNPPVSPFAKGGKSENKSILNEPQTKRFQRKIEDFTCENCGTSVKGDGYTNHCPECFWSKHVDINPGDRLNSCRGLMKPVDMYFKNQVWHLIHECQKCRTKKTIKLKNVDKDKLTDIIHKEATHDLHRGKP